MDIRGPILDSMRQLDTPLADKFFGPENMNRLQMETANSIKAKTGISIDRQNPRDLAVIMRQIYITNVFNPYGQIVEQIDFMNRQVLNMTTSQVMTGLAQYINYLRDNNTQPIPIPLPKNTSLYGNKIPYNNKIGL